MNFPSECILFDVKMLREEYLHQMGVQVWISRDNLVRAPEKQDVSLANEREFWDIDAARRLVQPQSAPEVASDSETDEGVTNPVSESFGLAELGFAAPGIVMPGEATQPRKSLRFQLVFVSYKGIILVYQVNSEPGSEANSKPRPELKSVLQPHLGLQPHLDMCNQLCGDIVYALDRNASFQQSCSLNWPFLDSVQIEQNEESARQVVQNRLSELSRDCDQALVFGRYPASLIFGSTHQVSLYQNFQFGNLSTLILDDIHSYLEEPLTKKILWLEIERPG